VAIAADVPARRDQGLVDEATTRGRLVELEGRGDLLAGLAELGQLARVLFGGARGLGGGALGLEALLGLLLEALKDGLVLGLREAQLLEGVLVFAAFTGSGGGGVYFGAASSLPPSTWTKNQRAMSKSWAKHSSESWLVMGRRGWAAWLPALRTAWSLFWTTSGTACRKAVSFIRSLRLSE
jgi:hypothetical protein